MRYTVDHKKETRRKILDAVSRGFRKEGYDGIGVDRLIKLAGLTSGAFYSHFNSKRDAFRAVLEAGLDEVINAIPRVQQEFGANWLKAFVEYYLSESHHKDLECGCAIASLTPEVIRSDDELHGSYENMMLLIIDLMANGLAGANNDERRARAWAVLSILIGGLGIARAVRSESVITDISRAVTLAAIVAAGETIKPDVQL